MCEESLNALRGDEPVEVELRLAVRKKPETVGPVGKQLLQRSPLTDLPADELVPRLRSLLTQASTTIAAVAHQLETRAADIGDNTRAELRDDVLAVDEELLAIHALLNGPVDWESEFARLLKGEIPPFDNDARSDRADDE